MQGLPTEFSRFSTRTERLRQHTRIGGPQCMILVQASHDCFLLVVRLPRYVLVPRGRLSLIRQSSLSKGIFIRNEYMSSGWLGAFVYYHGHGTYGVLRTF